MRPPCKILKWYDQLLWQNPAQSWQPSWTGWQEPMYRGSTHWSHWSPSQWQEWGSGRHYAAPPWQKYQEPRAERRRRQPRRSQRAGKFTPPDARPIVTPPQPATAPPATAQAPAPAASQHLTTPPGPPTPPSTTELYKWLQAEGFDVSPPKWPRGRSQTPESKNKERETQEAQIPKKAWRPRYRALCQVLNTPDHAVKDGVVTQDMGGRLRPSFLPTRGVSRNHRGSQLCS